LRPSLRLAEGSIAETPVGPVTIYCADGEVLRLVFGAESVAGGQEVVDPLCVQVKSALTAYFFHSKVFPELPLAPVGSVFCQTVWRALLTVPYGSTITYGQLAKWLDSAPRAVAQACRRNPLPLLIPCHRVVAANGIGGYAGETTGPLVARKRWLLDHEAGGVSCG